MFSLLREEIPEVLKDKLVKWAKDEACLTVIQLLHDQATQWVADAGNCLVDSLNHPDEIDKAKQMAFEATFYRQMAQVLDDMSRGEFNWQTAKQPKIRTTYDTSTNPET